MNRHQVTISGALGRAIRDQQIGFRPKGEGVKASIAALAGIDESAVELVSGGGQWHVNLPNAEAQAAFYAALDRVKEQAEQNRKAEEAQREQEEKEFQDFSANN